MWTEYLTECNIRDVEPFAINRFCMGRMDDSFKVLFKYFVPTIVAKNKFKARLFTQVKTDSNMCTISDEACTLLLLENNYDRWKDVHKNKMEGSTTLDPAVARQDEKRKRKWESDVSPKYTDGGIVYSDNRKMSHKGWKETGIRRFNDLCVLVKQDCAEHANVMTEMVRLWKEGMHRTTKTKSDDINTGIAAFHELWVEEDPDLNVAV